MTRGLAVGKFYPPHNGHHHLIRTAKALVDEMVVVVCDLPGQTPDASTRAEWLRQIHPDCDIRVVPDIGYDDDSQVWADYTRQWLPGEPDIVFTSETYGETYAACLRCKHVCVDFDRESVPVSGTLVRTEPAKHWQHLDPIVRAGMTKRIALVGAESTGTTTLTMALAERFNTSWVAEYGREYTIVRPSDLGDWFSDEFVVIARQQQVNEDAAALDAGPIMFCDTDAFATAIWHERYVGGACAEVEEIAAARTYSAYILTGEEIPFVQDGYRDGEHIRGWMNDRFRQRLAERSEPWIEVHGDVETRVQAVVKFLTDLFGEAWIPESARLP
jgi:HTH-type transcriptional regulator, transcriptional repressor of NAD biosynthesis genes